MKFVLVLLMLVAVMAACMAATPVPGRVSLEKDEERPGIRIYKGEHLLPKKPTKFPIKFKAAREV